MTTMTIMAPMAPMTIRVFVPQDSLARALGADAIAAEIEAVAKARDIPIDVVRNGSRGLYWLEPLVEVETAAGRVGYAKVKASDMAELVDAGMLQGAPHQKSIGLVSALPYLQAQQRVTFARMGVTDPLSLDDYQQHGGWRGLRRALSLKPEAIIADVLASGLRGRGGAAFPAAIKWQTVAKVSTPSTAQQKYVVCNADEGDSGTFADRMVMESDPFMLIEGMIIAGLAVDAAEGWIYIRDEYPQAIATMQRAVELAREAGVLGPSVLGSEHAFEIKVRRAAGSYVCGEETAMLESLEGRRGVVRAKPPLPAVSGLFGCPTVINNVLTLAAVSHVLADGGEQYASLGVGRSRGTLPFQLAGNVARGGIVELPFGVTLRTLVEDFGGGTRSGRPIKAIQVGGPLGAYIAPKHWDDPIDYEGYLAMGATVGHGGIVVHDDQANMAQLARYAMAFCAHESCGKCTPCRIGSTRGVEVIDRLLAAPDGVDQEVLLRDLCDTMTHGSLCAMGGMTPYPVLSAIDQYRSDFGLATKVVE